MFVKNGGEKNPHRVAKDDRIRNLHHRGLQMQRKQQPAVSGILDLGLQKFDQAGFVHYGGINNFASQHGHRRLQYVHPAIRPDQFDPQVSSLADGRGSFIVQEITDGHCRHMRTGLG